MTTWQHAVADKRRRQHLSLPAEWILPHTALPSPEHLDVLDFPETCGLLSAKEVEITNTGVEGLLERMRGGGWKAVEVLSAFAKRAVVAHQLVSESLDANLMFDISMSCWVDELPYGGFYR
jgi:amidase